MKEQKNLGAKIFSFAVMADSHVNQDEMACNSPFPVNTLANRRLRYVVEDLNHQGVDFVLHLGDIIHPVPGLADIYGQAAHNFHVQKAQLNMPMFLVPGNHDIGDKPMPWAPAGTINTEYIKLWRKHFGADYYSFSHGKCHFIILNAQLYNSGLPEEQAQEKWLTHDLDTNRGKRIFINLHYPPFIYKSCEEEHYDNIAEPARTTLLELLANYKIEALFAGHVHNFWYLQEKGMSCYLLPSTAFVRQDYAEMMPSPPSDYVLEAGRNDYGKLGYFLVHVYENDHVIQMVRTGGKMLGEEGRLLEKKTTVPLKAPRESSLDLLGFDLRNNWALPHSIAPSGGLDEFNRKLVRNDYPLLALTEMGVVNLRIPVQDLRNPEVRSRMADYIRLGHRFTLFSYGIPTAKEQAEVKMHQDLLAAWEITTRISDMETQAKKIDSLCKKSQLPIYIGKLWEHGEHETDAKGKKSARPYYHVINHGFVASDKKKIKQIWEQFSHKPNLVFRLQKDDSAKENIDAVMAIANQVGVKASIHIRMAGSNPAEATTNERFITNQVVEALLAGLAYPGLRLFADTLVDVDRGYFPRYGVLDTLCNPRKISRVLAHLHGVLHIENLDEVKVQKIQENGFSWILVHYRERILAVPLSKIQDEGWVKIPEKLVTRIDGFIDLASGEVYRDQDLESVVVGNVTPFPNSPVMLLARK